ncbi:hypothetical protein [Actinomadura rayongensis]|uniref:Uncharacterized protein n=1 Tax=Actinomadura rayongensis TaxID=1429076 RepID=A0A6I4WHD7_9ACTN|nr:hypothetical protein [Actinomadura rayongensis]MXQ67715.1 hypothetical protein [Actinomadura rayongensis]
MCDYYDPTDPEVAARLGKIRYRYTVLTAADPFDCDEDVSTELKELEKEYFYATGKDITLMDDEEAYTWANKGAKEAEALLGY